MIGRIRGRILEKKAPEILLDTGSIAYEVQVPMSTVYQLPDIGEEVVLHTHFVVREDAQLLYGFHDVQEKTLFRTLIKVSGVGPKLALTILSGMAVSDFVNTVRNNDVAALVNMPGVGKKTAERLLVEMRDRISEFGTTDSDQHSGDDGTGSKALRGGDIARDAETALISLGYKPPQAARAIAAILKDNDEDN